MRILIDMNMSPLWVSYLSAHGFESIHWSFTGQPTAPDEEILRYARENGFVILTHDLDFGGILAKQRTSNPSVIQIRCQDVLPAAIGATVISAVETCRQHLETGALVTIDPARHRIRILPI